MPKKKPVPVYNFQLPADIGRGWVNPQTGIVPERLGV